MFAIPSHAWFMTLLYPHEQFGLVAHGGQETPDSPEAMKSVPGLELSDIPKALPLHFQLRYPLVM